MTSKITGFTVYARSFKLAPASHPVNLPYVAEFMACQISYKRSKFRNTSLVETYRLFRMRYVIASFKMKA